MVRLLLDRGAQIETRTKVRALVSTASSLPELPVPRADPANTLLAVGEVSDALKGWSRFFAGTCRGEGNLRGYNGVPWELRFCLIFQTSPKPLLAL